MKPHLLFLNILLIGAFSLSLLAPEHASGASPENRRSGETPPARIPVIDTTNALPPLLNIAAIATGRNHTCALTAGGGVKCWGDNEYGQLGDGTTTDRHTSVNVIGLASGVSAIATGGKHTCALTAEGGVKCWGWNKYGQLGSGTGIRHLMPVDVSGLASVVSAITAGEYHTCARTAGGGVKCWGRNYEGQLGDGTTTNHLTPVNVSGLASGVSGIRAGYYHTCARTAGGGVKCWGDNQFGQLGDGTTTNRLTPVNVYRLVSGISGIAAGGQHTCVRNAERRVKCWGANYYGQLGDGTTTRRLRPINVNGLASGVSAITAGSSHTCALTSESGVKCWGHNFSGELGDGTTTDRHTPIDVTGLASGVGAITAGGSHTCARTRSGGVKCWGANWSGQLGDGTTTNRHRPMNVLNPMLTKLNRSDGAYDGNILESSEFSNLGGTINATATNFRLGDDAQDRQYRTILSFDTSGLPDDAIITSAVLKIKKQGMVGDNPFTTHEGLLVDIKKPYFGKFLALAAHDFQRVANNLAVGTFGTVPSSGLYSVTLRKPAYPYINLTGTTQLRLRFKLDDDDDNTADFMEFYSGNKQEPSDRPLLVIEYYVP